MCTVCHKQNLILIPIKVELIFLSNVNETNSPIVEKQMQVKHSKVKIFLVKPFTTNFDFEDK